MLSRRTIRFRLTLWYAIVLAAALAMFGGLIWFSLRQRLLAGVDRDLESRAARFERFFTLESGETSGAQLIDELQEFCQGMPPDGKLSISGASGFAFHCPSYVASADLRTATRRFEFEGDKFEIQAAAPLTNVRHTLELLRILLFALIPAVILIASAGGAWLSDRALRPIQQITAAAHTIGIENLSERLPVAAAGDELAQLSAVLNDMLNRLESAVKTLSQFAADASHELRTPVAVIRTTAELALRRERTPEEYREALAQVVAEAERMTRLVEDLLLLARSDAGTADMPLERVDVRPIITDVCSAMRSLADLRHISIRAEAGVEPALIAGNSAALHRLFLVLVDNAVKYSRDNGEVGVAIELSESRIAVAIRDSGCGIDSADLPHIFKRFYRAPAARASSGHGLGLALAERIAKAHRAAIDVVSSPEGSVFRVIFPRAATDEDASANLQIARVT